MDGVAFQAEAHQHGFDAQYLLEVGDDGDAASAAHGERLSPEGLGKAFLGGLVGRQVDGAHVALAAVHGRDLHADGTRGDGGDVVGKEAGDFLVLLMGHEAARHFGVGRRGEHRLRAFARVASPDAADVERRAAAVALQRGVALLALQLVDADGGLVARFVEGDLGYHAAFGFGDLFHAVVEVGDGDAAVGIGDLGQHLAEHVDGIGHRAAEVARVQVAVRAGDFYLPVGQAAQAGGERGQVGAQHAGVRHEDDVGAQQLAVLLEEGVQAGRAYLFLALEDELHVVAQPAVAHHVFKGFHLDERLSLVVVGSAGIDAPVADFGLEGVALPQFERLGRHYVVVGIDEHGGRVRRHAFLGIDQRIALRGHHHGFVGSGLEQEFFPALGAGRHVVLVFRLGADAGDADEARQLVNEAGFVFFDVFSYVHVWYGLDL